MPLPAGLAWGPAELQCHAQEWRPSFSKAPDHYSRRGGTAGHCSYCGSISCRDLYTFLRAHPYEPHPGYDIPEEIRAANDLAAFKAWEEEQRARRDSWRGVEVADWKYGWPHKLYLYGADDDMIKFYNRHLIDLAGHSGFNPLVELIARHTGIRFGTEDGILFYWCEPRECDSDGRGDPAADRQGETSDVTE